MNDYLNFAKALALKAGDIMLKHFDYEHEVEDKEDASPVTLVDKEINRLVVEEIKNKYPGHGLLGEEENLGDGSEAYQWICDPLDGTKPYILGIPNSVFMLALAENDKVLVAVVYDPYARKLFHAVKGKGAFCNDVQIKVSEQSLVGGYVLLGTTSYSSIDAVKAAGGKVEPVSGSGYKCMMIARGKGVGQIKSGADFHDVAPAALIVEEAGGKVTGLAGEELVLTKDIEGAIISNSAAHQELVEIAQALPGSNTAV